VGLVGDRWGTDLAGRWLDRERGVRNGGLMRALALQSQVDHEILFAQNRTLLSRSSLLRARMQL
jgi:hypothetical protein